MVNSFLKNFRIVLDDHRSGDLGGVDSGGQHSVTGEVLNQQELGVI
jgi:hypothetical protein